MNSTPDGYCVCDGSRTVVDCGIEAHREDAKKRRADAVGPLRSMIIHSKEKPRFEGPAVDKIELLLYRWKFGSEQDRSKTPHDVAQKVVEYGFANGLPVLDRELAERQMKEELRKLRNIADEMKAKMQPTEKEHTSNDHDIAERVAQLYAVAKELKPEHSLSERVIADRTLMDIEDVRWSLHQLEKMGNAHHTSDDPERWVSPGSTKLSLHEEIKEYIAANESRIEYLDETVSPEQNNRPPIVRDGVASIDHVHTKPRPASPA